VHNHTFKAERSRSVFIHVCAAEDCCPGLECESCGANSTAGARKKGI